MLTSHLSAAGLEARYETAADPVSKSHFHAIWLLSSGHTVTEVAAILSFSGRWVRLLRKRYNEQGPDSLGDRRAGQRLGARDPYARSAFFAERTALDATQ